MQRTKALIPLSHDHHHGLVLASRSLRALNEGGVRQAATRVLDFWEAELKAHFEEEERFVFPLLPETDDLILRAKDDHRRMRQQVAELSIADDAALAVTLERFAVLLEQHIRFEERTLFARIEEVATDEALLAVLSQLHRRQERQLP